ncbi:Phosphoglucosamine mutase [Dissulfuribacter thermophilus]|uniref:Phosphoglucosamine mutase n=1 Tax=Dissulfuribacter thermophilus TaxID=1156395 RepID=A0A1B9F497_9BACT|nr:phosphoglucosamine mutase [Dissulfuribacter thermophilus]OCC14758.1 Phosphoglucosamine mutase [Dissulfuribacter thermophilus]
MARLFGTDGVRGKANIYPMTVDIALRIGQAVACLFRENGVKHRKILIGKDTRISGYMFENALVSGICSMGVDALLVGPMPTPAIAFLTANMRADAGVVISASHNPFDDNGIKIFSGDGFKLPDDIEDDIENLIKILEDSSKEQRHRGTEFIGQDSGLFSKCMRPTGTDVGKAFRIDDAPGRYIVFLKNTFPRHLTLDGIKMVIDCANGATYKVAPQVFEELGARVIKIGVSPNGTNINEGCGALCLGPLRNAVQEYDAHIGVAFDGDGDRVIIIDEKGKVVDGDHIMAICAKYLMEQGNLNKNTVVATVMSNMGLELALSSMGARLVRTKVGDRYVVEEMRKNGYNFGGEQSGHLIFMDHITTGDGILAALQVLSVMQTTERPLSELAKVMECFPQVLENVRVRERKAVHEIPGLGDLVSSFEEEFKGRGRILIRPSGTEPVIRVMVEGEDHDYITEVARALCEHIQRAA